jgi:hypothetical protein
VVSCLLGEVQPETELDACAPVRKEHASSGHLTFIWVLNSCYFIPALEEFFTSLVRQEMVNMPRGIYHSALKGGVRSDQGKTVAGIPNFILKTYETNKQPGLKPGLAGKNTALGEVQVYSVMSQLVLPCEIVISYMVGHCLAAAHIYTQLEQLQQTTELKRNSKNAEAKINR